MGNSGKNCFLVIWIDILGSLAVLHGIPLGFCSEKSINFKLQTGNDLLMHQKNMWRAFEETKLLISLNFDLHLETHLESSLVKALLNIFPFGPENQPNAYFLIKKGNLILQR